MALTDVKSEQIQSSVALAGSPTTTTQSASDNSTKIATTAYVETAVANLVASAPSALNTLDELAAALNDDASFSTTITNSIATKAPLASPTFTGTLTVPTLITGAYGAGGSAGDGFRLNSTDLYGQVDASDKVRIAVAGDSYFGGGKVGIAEGGVIYATRFSVGKPHTHTPGSAFTNSPSSFYSEVQLGGTTGDDQKLVTFAGTDNSNVSGLTLYRYRRSTGTNWTTDGFSLRQEVDNTENLYDYINFAGGNVGIGTASPAQKLEVVSSGFAYLRTRSTASGFTGFDIGQHTGGNIYLNNRDNTSIILQTNNSPRMYLTNSGDVGIGVTPSGTYKLQVNGGIQLSAKSLIDNSAYFISGTNGFRWNNSSDAHNNCIMYDNGNMYVRGQVGIGATPSGSIALEVVNSGEARIKARSTNNNWAGLDLESNSTQSGYIFFRDNSAERARIQVTDGNDIIFQNTSSHTERMRISNTGIVTTPNQPYFQANGSGSAWTTVTSENSWNYGIHNNTASYWGEGTDRGAGYFNPSNGRFTAPVTGWYTFQCSVYIRNTNGVEGAYLHPQFFRNGVLAYQNGKNPYKIVQTKTTTNPEYMFVEWSENIYLTATQYVTVNIYFRSEGAWQHYPDYSVFTGGLIG